MRLLAAAAALLACGSIAGAAPIQSKLDVWVVGVDGRGRTDLTAADSFPAASPRVSPSGKLVAYVHGDGRIWLMNPDGSNQRPLYHDMPLDVVHSEANPVWSPDGKRIAYDDLEVLPIAGFSIAVRDVKTGALVQGFADAADPTWSPGGRKIAFERGVSPTGDYADSLVVATLSTGTGRVLDSGVLSPSWAPNGKLVAFYSGIDEEFVGPGVYLGYLSGPPETRRLSGGAPDSGPLPPPTWSPDSKRIAFTTESGQLRVIKLDKLDRPHARIVGRADASPSWSPDGMRIADFSTSGDLRIRVLKTGRSRLVTHAPGGFYGVPPSWSRDGKRLYFTSSSQ